MLFNHLDSTGCLESDIKQDSSLCIYFMNATIRLKE